MFCARISIITGVTAPRRGQPIEQRVLIEARHVDAPVCRRAPPVQRQRAVGFARHRHDPPIDRRSGSPIQAHLGLAGCATQVGRGKVQIVEAHRALQLEGAVASEEHDGAMCIDPFDRRAAVRRWRRKDSMTGCCVSQGITRAA